MRDGRDLVGFGLAAAIYDSSRYPTSASVALLVDGMAVVRCATIGMGQRHHRRVHRPVPVNADVHELDAISVDAREPLLNPLGVKGVAELGLCGVAPAIANAVYNAIGKRVRDLPITPDRLLTACGKGNSDGPPSPDGPRRPQPRADANPVAVPIAQEAADSTQSGHVRQGPGLELPP